MSEGSANSLSNRVNGELDEESMGIDPLSTDNIELLLNFTFGVRISEEALQVLTSSNINEKSIVETKPLAFLHVEYSLCDRPEENPYQSENEKILDGPDDCTKTTLTGNMDIIVLLGAVKIICLDGNSRLCSTYVESATRTLWFTFNLQHVLSRSDKLLLKLFKYDIVARFWLDKEFCNGKNRNDKFIKLISRTKLKDDAIMMQKLVKQELLKFKKTLIASWQLNRPLPMNIITKDSFDSDDDIDEFKTIQMEQPTIVKSPSPPIPDELSDIQIPESEKIKLRSVRQKREMNDRMEMLKRTGSCSMRISLEELFGPKNELIFKRLSKPVGVLEDLFMSLEVQKGPFLTDEQIIKWKPMSFHIKTISDLPYDSMWTFDHLNEMCLPLFISYRILPNTPLHYTRGFPHKHSIGIDDFHVILLGEEDNLKVLELLMSNELHLTVHNRELKPETYKKLSPKMFGEGKWDSEIQINHLFNSELLVENAFDLLRKPPKSPVGICQVNLTPIIMETTRLSLRLNVRSEKAMEKGFKSKPRTLMEKWKSKTEDNEIWRLPKYVNENDADEGIRLSSLKNVEKILPKGPNWIDCDTTVNMVVRTHRPLVNEMEYTNLLRKDEETFGRLIFICYSTEIPSLIDQIQVSVRNINATALNLHHLSQPIIQIALSMYKLTEKQYGENLDIINGFYLFDGEKHVMVLEGLREAGLRLLYEWLSKPDYYSSSIQILYSHELHFSQRLYQKLDVDLLRIKLMRPLDLLMKQPDLFSRNARPQKAFDALQKIYSMLQFNSTKPMRHSETYPTIEELRQLVRYYGTVQTFEDIEATKLQERQGNRTSIFNDQEMTSQSVTKMSRGKQAKVQMERTIHRDFLRRRAGHSGRKELNSVKKSIAPPIRIESASVNEKDKNSTIKGILFEGEGLYERSGTLNGTIIVDDDGCVLGDKPKEKLRPIFKKRWRCHKGVIVYGHKTEVESNRPDLLPTDLRLEQLRKPWTERELFRNKFIPSLEERRDYPFEEKEKDIQRYFRCRPTLPDNRRLFHVYSRSYSNDVYTMNSRL
ncbi:hypothetical protein SNEBB_003711 [Seison nebaliae]|nr:hypothetical protein SNEBB_003711 [Seison nebaliae]